MKVSVQVIVHSDDDTGASSVVREVLRIGAEIGRSFMLLDDELESAAELA